jgi:hypothetical protein
LPPPSKNPGILELNVLNHATNLEVIALGAEILGTVLVITANSDRILYIELTGEVGIKVI